MNAKTSHPQKAGKMVFDVGRPSLSQNTSRNRTAFFSHGSVFNDRDLNPWGGGLFLNS